MVSGQEEVPIGATGRIRSLHIAGLLLLGLLASGFVTSTTPAPVLVRFLAAFVVVVWIPGVVVVRDLLGVAPQSSLVRYPLYFFAGTSAVSLLTWPFLFWHSDFTTYRTVLLWVLVVLFATGWLVARRRAGGARPRLHRGAAVSLALLIGVFSFLPTSRDVARDDYDHMGYIRQVVATDATDPEGVLAQPVDAGGEAPSDPRKGTYQDVVAVVSSLGAVDPANAWALQPMILFPLALFAFVAFCREFVSRRWQLLSCVVLFVVSYGGMGYRYPEMAAGGQSMALAWYWLATPLVLRNWARGWAGDGVLALLCAGGVFVHLGVALHGLVLALTVVAFAPAIGVESGARRRALVLAAAAMVAALWRVSWAHGEPNALHMHEQGVLTIGRWLVVSPLEVLRQNGMLFLGGLAMVPLLVLWIRRPVLRRALLFAAVPLACNFVPFFATVLIREGSYLIARTLLNVPVFPIIVLGFAAFVTWSRARGWGARAVAAVVLIAWSLTFVAPAVRALDLALSSPPRAASPPASRELVDYVRHLPAESVILSDTRTSYYLSALTVHRFVAVHGQHANPLDPYALDRLQAVRDVLSPYVVSSRALEACRRYGVDFVVCNAASGSRGDEFMSTWDVHDYPLTVARLESIAGRFRLVHRGEKFVVFLYDPSGTGSSTWGPPRTLVSYAPVAGMEQCVVVAPDGAFRITGVAATPQHALPGESIAVTLGYEKSRERAFGIPFVLHLRLDHESIERERDYPLAKHVRRFQERRRGVSARVTVRHVPFGGRYDVDLWPIGRDFYETVEVALPTNLLPGRYTLRVSIERSSLLPNFALGDLLYNHDRLHGVACASVEVSRQRVRGP